MREDENQLENFFTNTDVLTSQSILVRESIQNAIDAKLKNSSAPVSITFKLGKVGSQVAQKYFGELSPRIVSALGSSYVQAADKDCQYLAVEDFNTTGLDGPITSVRPASKPNSFWFFTWASGTSNKGTGTRGKNGVGKIVFPRSSGIKSQLVLSIRDNHEPGFLVFGNAFLKFHDFDGLRWNPDCRWMTKDENGMHVPFQDDNTREEFVKDWKLTRNSSQSGTSIIVPYVDDGFSANKITQCIVQDYFVAILDGTIECRVIDFTGEEVLISSDTIESHLTDMDEDLLTRASKTKEELLGLCKIYKNKLQSETLEIDLILANQDGKRNSWPEEALTEVQRAEIKNALDAGKTVEFKLSVLLPELRADSKNALVDTYSVLLGRHEDTMLNPTFSREGILIPSAATGSGRLKDSLFLVVISSGGLADVLGDAEGPAHERWSAEEEKFKNKYIKLHGEQLIRCIKDSPSRIAKALKLSPDTLESSHFSKWFPNNDEGYKRIEQDDSDKGKKKKIKQRKAGGGGGGSAISEGIHLDPTPDGFRLSKLPGVSESLVGKKLKIRAGYSTGKGNSPLTLSSDDFLMKEHLDVSSGVSVESWEDNTCVIQISKDDFKIEFNKFDIYRDLTVGTNYVA